MLKVFNTIEAMRSAVAESLEPVALVPTMGYLHEGHMTLVRRALELSSRVAVSIFVNPLQFGPNEDFAKYPRNTERDLSMLRQVGVTYVFVPDMNEITPGGNTFKVDPGPMANTMCGKTRPGHFIGVSTIVLKLFNIVQPRYAVFGWKDAQQLLILMKMVRELDVPVELIGVETVREPDGLAMSSRNSYLTPEERAQAPALHRGLEAVRTAVLDERVTNPDTLRTIFSRTLSGTQLRQDYLAIVSCATLEPLQIVEPGNVLAAAAVFLGKTRLIDNLRF